MPISGIYNCTLNAHESVFEDHSAWPAILFGRRLTRGSAGDFVFGALHPALMALALT